MQCQLVVIIERTFTPITGLDALDNADFGTRNALLTIKVWIFGNKCLPL